MKLMAAIVWLSAIFFMVYGLLFTFLPSIMASAVTGSGPDTASSMIDFRSTYGGLQFGVGLILAVLANSDKTLPLGLLSVTIILGGMALARAWGIYVDGNPNIVMYVYLVMESGTAFVTLIGYAMARR